MTDGDQIRGLNRSYQKRYNDLSEGKATNDECARSLIKSLQRDIKNKGDIPVILSKSMGEILTQAISDAGGIAFVNWATLRQEFSRLVEQADSSHYLKELVLRAGRSILHELEHGEGLGVDFCPSEAILCRYMTEVYEAGFKECISLGADEAIRKRLAQIELDVLTAIHKWSKKADADRSVGKLRLPPLSKVKEADFLEDDVLAAHNHNNSKKIGEFLQIFSKDSQITDQDLKHYLSTFDGVSV